MITLLDYGAGNVRSVRNAITTLGFEVRDASSPDDIRRAEKIVFPGVGSFGSAMDRLNEKGFIEPLLEFLKADKPFLGICLGLQTLFEGSDEAPGVRGLGIIAGQIGRFDEKLGSVPQIGWNGINIRKSSPLFKNFADEKLYFVHSYRAMASEQNRDWVLTTTDYHEEFVSSVQKGNVVACQFHPEKSGKAGLNILKNFLAADKLAAAPVNTDPAPTRIAKRIIACLDVRNNDAGDLVVTKGDQYDVREEGEVRNLGKPVELAKRYYDEGADEVTFLNITAFRNFPLQDQPMIEVLKRSSENVFVPLTIGGGIREFTDSEGKFYSSLDVASEYFRSGADKISIGSDAVHTVEAYLQSGKATGMSSIEQISRVYGNQAVVISVDPRRVYVKSPDDTPHFTIKTRFPGPNGEEYCWYQCTVKGGREGRDIDVVQLVTVCEKLGAGEILLNCMDKDGTNSGYDLEMTQMVKDKVTIPVIASSGAGKVEHFSEVFKATDVEAALAAGIFHRKEVPISAVKKHLQDEGIEIR
ncbi:MAG: imidazole glycerol phosphate synthase subunit HisF [Proteobacteria bacterium]|nr:imidazole glycerol phosphate synthase subunit HisF [Pseudomonadota bacterium]MBU1739546.1 imidazole glycerol phosphate synthase subunit HisF [Pseudomonadota bacterium]